MLREKMILMSKRILPTYCIIFLLTAGMLYDIVNYMQFVNKYIYFLIFALLHVLLIFVVASEKGSDIKLSRISIWAIFSLSLGITTIVNSYIFVRSWLFFMPLMLLVWFVLMPAIKFELDDILFILKWIVFLGIIYCFANLIINYDILFSFWNTADAYKNNCQGVYFNKNYWGQALLPFIMANVLVLFGLKKNKIFWWVTLFILLYNIVASLSRAAILTMCIFGILLVLFIFIRSGNLNLKKVIIFFSLIILVLFSLSESYQLKNLWYNYFFRTHNILTFRDTLWRIAWNYSKDMPFWGYGFGSQLHLIEAYGVRLGAFHNTYIDLFMQGGIVHLVVNLAIFAQSFFAAYKLYGINLRLGAVLMSALFAFGIYCNVEYVTLYIFSMPNILFCFILLSLPNILFKTIHENVK